MFTTAATQEKGSAFLQFCNFRGSLCLMCPQGTKDTMSLMLHFIKISMRNLPSIR